MAAQLGSVVKGVSLPEEYAKLMQFKKFNLSQFVEWAWWRWRKGGRNDWPPLVKGQYRRKQTTVSLKMNTATDVQMIETGYPAFNFSAWCEKALYETYPRNFLPGGRVSWV
jgi:hypothetical protein